MSVKYEGQSPSRLWYAWQRTKALASCLKDNRTEKDAKKMVRMGGLSVASFGSAALASNYLFFIPLVPTLSGLAGLGIGGYFGWKSWQKVKLLKESDTVYRYIRKQEENWIQKKSRPSLATRAAAFGKRLFGRAALPFAIAGKWSGYGTALLGVATSALAAAQAMGTGQASFAAGVAKLGTAFGLAAPVALAAVAAVAIIAIPVGLGVGKICRSITKSLRKDFIAHQAGAGMRPFLKSRLEKPVAQKPATVAPRDNSPATQASESFQQSAAPKTEPLATKKPEMSEAQKKAAAARAAARANSKGKLQQWL